ncbi:MAG: hypothetical protein NC114_10630 [Ruminococcus flavefaciens]|nr:hypothetical protein [Ruminococcus flavefaciens]
MKEVEMERRGNGITPARMAVDGLTLDGKGKCEVKVWMGEKEAGERVWERIPENRWSLLTM